MATTAMSMAQRRSWLAGALTVTRRELRDTMRDWRLVGPIVFLTLFFPVLMNFTVGVIRNFLLQYGSTNLILSERLMPFFLMIVGFFPISFSLVVALETFVGERERKSIEALLCTPLSNGQLYLGKMLAAMIPPVSAAYLGITVYVISLYLLRGWTIPPIVLLQVVLLTTCAGLVMVSGAVIVSSQTTSTRAANLLASFIIIPMALIVQAESAAMFLADYGVLWGFIAALIVIALLLIRIGTRLFDREELLGREFDTINLKKRWRTFKRFFGQVDPYTEGESFSLWRVYRRDLPAIVRRSSAAGWTVLAATTVGVVAGVAFAQTQPPAFGFGACASDVSTISFQFILWNNLRTVLFSGFIGVFTLGVLPVVVPFVNSGLVAFAVMGAAAAGHSPLTLFAAGILPHGVFELPGVWLASMLALRLGAVFTGHQSRMTLGESWLLALADYMKVLIFVVVPLLLLGAIVETTVTPTLLCGTLGR